MVVWTAASFQEVLCLRLSSDKLVTSNRDNATIEKEEFIECLSLKLK